MIGFINKILILILWGRKKMKGKVVINFEHTIDGDCIWNFDQSGDEKLSNDDLVYLLETIVRDIIEEQD